MSLQDIKADIIQASRAHFSELQIFKGVVFTLNSFCLNIHFIPCGGTRLMCFNSVLPFMCLYLSPLNVDDIYTF